jgi:hypothetical protein
MCRSIPAYSTLSLSRRTTLLRLAIREGTPSTFSNLSQPTTHSLNNQCTLSKQFILSSRCHSLSRSATRIPSNSLDRCPTPKSRLLSKDSLISSLSRTSSFNKFRFRPKENLLSARSTPRSRRTKSSLNNLNILLIPNIPSNPRSPRILSSFNIPRTPSILRPTPAGILKHTLPRTRSRSTSSTLTRTTQRGTRKMENTPRAYPMTTSSSTLSLSSCRRRNRNGYGWSTSSSCNSSRWACRSTRANTSCSPDRKDTSIRLSTTSKGTVR